MQIIERSRVFNGHYKVNQLIVQDGDTQLKREQFAPGKAVAALVYDTARQVYVLTRQFRIGHEAGDLDPVTAGHLSHLMPVFGVVLAVVFLDERLRPYHLVGIALIAAGLWLADRRFSRPSPNA